MLTLHTVVCDHSHIKNIYKVHVLDCIVLLLDYFKINIFQNIALAFVFQISSVIFFNSSNIEL